MALKQDEARTRDIQITKVDACLSQKGGERRNDDDESFCNQSKTPPNISCNEKGKSKNYETIWKKHIEIRKFELESNEELQKWLNLW
mmetsp:Transcript_24878/g.56158  ORF Transcript_24878/g.56158 Transcript_24878/m.56158 type:complete len:87 (-) Transcript_24878:45-305(-)|eukprot:767677-Hanusia_phi.AAC.2